MPNEHVIHGLSTGRKPIGGWNYVLKTEWGEQRIPPTGDAKSYHHLTTLIGDFCEQNRMDKPSDQDITDQIKVRPRRVGVKLSEAMIEKGKVMVNIPLSQLPRKPKHQ